jgi:Tfp pilus assembly protein PilV
MIKQQHIAQAGFSAVELLITLFVAAAFVGTGAQLYSVIIQNSDEARMRAKATNIAYDNLRHYAADATNPCTASTPPATIPANSGLPAASISLTITCPFGVSTPTSRVEARVLYSSPQQETVHAIYVTN